MKKFAVLFCIVIFFAPSALADVIIMKDGGKIEGRVKNIVNNQVGIEGDTELYYIPMDKVSKIIYVKATNDDDTMKWVTGISLVATILLGVALGIWGRDL